MDDRARWRTWIDDHVHRAFERLTTARGRLAILRRRYQRGAVDPAEVQVQLTRVDNEIALASATLGDLRQQAERLLGAPDGAPSYD